MKSLTIVMLALLTTACASTYSSIELGEDDNYYITEIYESGFGISSHLLQCKATSTTEMQCRDID